MPLYSFVCLECGHEFDRRQHMTDGNPACAECRGDTRKRITRVTVHFIGDGFASNDT